ncbi:MAG: hypothetical protein JSV88_05685 [Candidatus Aminicenantes bacterium]|nr:MAG: hypothetical protein JSV88_05685 [Candidatus Aminicenantes bacterium]
MDRGEKKQTRRMRNVLFCIFLLFFVVIVAGTIATVFLDFGKPTPDERAVLFKVFMVEIGIAVLALFKILFGLKKKPAKEEKPIPKVAGKYNYEAMYSDNKTTYYGECRIKQDGRILKLNGFRKKIAVGRKKNNISIPWYSNWAELCTDNKIRMDYSITYNGRIKGYLILEVGAKNPRSLVGEFHLLTDPYVYGIATFTRR